jgi:hypothetical protein
MTHTCRLAGTPNYGIDRSRASEFSLVPECYGRGPVIPIVQVPEVTSSSHSGLSHSEGTAVPARISDYADY